MDRVFIRNDGKGLVAVLEDGHKLVRAYDVVGILIALQIANIDEAALVIEPPGSAHEDHALTTDQYIELMDVLGRHPEN